MTIKDDKILAAQGKIMSAIDQSKGPIAAFIGPYGIETGRMTSPAVKRRLKVQMESVIGVYDHDVDYRDVRADLEEFMGGAV